MSLEWRLAWRNVWRNPRRTGLTVSATVFAVALLVLMSALSTGMWEKIIDDSVSMGSGHVTLTGPNYLEERTLEQYTYLDAPLATRLGENPAIAGYAPRVNAFGLLSDADVTRGVMVIGVDPELEKSVSSLPDRIKSGRFLEKGKNREVVLGGRLAEILGVKIGDQVLLYSVAYSLESAYDLFSVAGIMHLPDPALDRGLALISLADAQAFFVYGNRISEVAIRVREADHSASLAEQLGSSLDPEKIEAHPWPEVMPDLAQTVVIDKLGMYLMLAILVIVVAFGIFNTILMAVLERKREFGVVLALGLRPRAIFRIVYLESILLAGVGLTLGLLVAIPLVLYLQANPIPITNSEEMAAAFEMVGTDPVIYAKLIANNPILSALTILLVALLAALYPAIRASQGKPVDVLRSL
ncbi:MAG: ABC transporter permease [Myxococcota bacterium]|jgi:putative ABC transport system permease protein|nr:ABC transporter permease [Myxococcota bacterium]